MPNQPAQDTVTVSFTLPRSLDEAIERKAEQEITNKSDIIRRALMNHITPEERARVIAQSRRYPEARSQNYALNDKPSSVKAGAAAKLLKKHKPSSGGGSAKP